MSLTLQSNPASNKEFAELSTSVNELIKERLMFLSNSVYPNKG